MVVNGTSTTSSQDDVRPGVRVRGARAHRGRCRRPDAVGRTAGTARSRAFVGAGGPERFGPLDELAGHFRRYDERTLADVGSRGRPRGRVDARATAGRSPTRWRASATGGARRHAGRERLAIDQRTAASGRTSQPAGPSRAGQSRSVPCRSGTCSGGGRTRGPDCSSSPPRLLIARGPRSPTCWSRREPRGPPAPSTPSPSTTSARETRATARRPAPRALSSSRRPGRPLALPPAGSNTNTGPETHRQPQCPDAQRQARRGIRRPGRPRR